MERIKVTAIRDKDAGEAIMNAVIVYDDNAIAAKAKAMLDRAAWRADEALLWSVKPWKFEMLLWPPTAATVLDDARTAQLLVLAIRDPAAPPSWLLDWLEQWALERHVPEAALAVFDGKHGDSLSSPPSRALSRFAERHGLCFILDDVLPGAEEAAAFPDDPHHHELAQPRGLTNYPGQSSYIFPQDGGMRSEARL